MADRVFMQSKKTEAGSVGYREHMTGVWLPLIAAAQERRDML